MDLHTLCTVRTARPPSLSLTLYFLLSSDPEPFLCGPRLPYVLCSYTYYSNWPQYSNYTGIFCNVWYRYSTVLCAAYFFATVADDAVPAFSYVFPWGKLGEDNELKSDSKMPPVLIC